MAHVQIETFIPLFYLVWSDDLLTPLEFTTLKNFIEAQEWLTEDDRKLLLSKIDTSNPPSRDDISDWKNKIEAITAENPSIKSIYEIAVALSGGTIPLQNLEASFATLEHNLGFASNEIISNFKTDIRPQTATLAADINFDQQKLTAILDGKQAPIINKVKGVISRPEFQLETSTETNVYREKVYQWCKILAAENLGNMAYPKKYGGGENIADYFAIMETLSYHDLSLVIKFGVQFGLWGMSVHSLGTEKHYEKYLKDIGTLQLAGCFAMTETHHGSNVKGLETTATYDHTNKSFTIDTPHPKAQKEYIGNAALHGQMATVFAKLIIDGHDYGVNAFIVPLRDGQGIILEGITIGDCGHKMGLNGVDNGTIRFNNVCIPKENMLDRFASVNAKGEFTSPIPSDNRRFFTMLNTAINVDNLDPKVALRYLF